MKKFIAAIGVLFFMPVVAFATNHPRGDFGQITVFFNNIVGFINSTLVPLVFALAFLVFIWGVFKYFIMGGDDEGKREEGRSLMLYAIIGFILMVSVWGIVNLLAGGLGLDDETIENTLIPQAPDSTNSPGGGGTGGRGGESFEVR